MAARAERMVQLVVAACWLRPSSQWTARRAGNALAALQAASALSADVLPAVNAVALSACLWAPTIHACAYTLFRFLASSRRECLDRAIPLRKAAPARMR